MPIPHEYFLQVIGKGFNVDGLGNQCVSGFKHWCNTLLGLNYYGKSICYPSNYAYSIWDNFDSLGLGRYFDKVPSNQMVDGDWAIWNVGSPACPSSHIAMFRKDNGNGTGIFLGQNQGGKNGVYNQRNISYNGIRGALRPKIYHQAQQGEAVDQILHKGSKVQLEGTYVVKDINVKENTALINIDGKDYWISSTPLKEV